ncbi:MAG: hypothetical protein J1F42_03225 [Lachnospiraceae bacterium]|nr:hypothetical protein [Lachnospiraceae bacterium]
MAQETRFATKGVVWDEYFPRIRFITISSMVVIWISFIILNCIESLYSEWTHRTTGQEFLGISHAIIAGVSVVGVLALLLVKNGNRVVAATGTIVLNSVIAVWQIWYFRAQIGGHWSYTERQWFVVLAVETVIQVVCCIMEVSFFRKILGAHETNDEV